MESWGVGSSGELHLAPEVENPSAGDVGNIDSDDNAIREVQDVAFNLFLRSVQHGSRPLEKHLKKLQQGAEGRQEGRQAAPSSSPLDTVLASTPLVGLLSFFTALFMAVSYSRWPFPANTPKISGHHFRLIAIKGGGVQPTVSDLAAFGLMVDGCRIELRNRTVSGAVMTMSSDTHVKSNGWWVETQEESPPRRSAKLTLEASTDGETWQQIGGSSWRIRSNLRIDFGDGALNLPANRSHVIQFDHRVPWFWLFGKVVGDVVMSGRLLLALLLAWCRRPWLAKTFVFGNFYVSAICCLIAAVAFGLHGWTSDAVAMALRAVANLLLVSTIDTGVELFVPSLTAAGALVVIWEALDACLIRRRQELFWSDPPIEAMALLAMGIGLAVAWVWLKYRAWLLVRQDQLLYDDAWEHLLSCQGVPALLGELHRVCDTMTRGCHDKRDARTLNRVRQPGDTWTSVAHRKRGASFDSRPPLDHRSPVRCVEQLLCQATLLNPILRRKVQAWAIASRGCVPVMGRSTAKPELRRWSEVGRDGGGREVWATVKHKDRAMQKLLCCYHKDPSRLLDVCRQRLAFESVSDILGALRVLSADPDIRVVRVTNRMDKHYDSSLTAGYRDVRVNFRIESLQTWEFGLDAHVCELQLVLTDFAALQSRESHRRFQHYRLSRPAEASRWSWAGLRLLRWLRVIHCRRHTSSWAPPGTLSRETSREGSSRAADGGDSATHFPTLSPFPPNCRLPSAASQVTSSNAVVKAALEPERQRPAKPGDGDPETESAVDHHHETEAEAAPTAECNLNATALPTPLVRRMRRTESVAREGASGVDGTHGSVETESVDEGSARVDAGWVREQTLRLTCVAHAELHGKISDVADAVGRASTDSLVFTSRPLAAGISRLRWQVLMSLVGLYSLAFACNAFAQAWSHGWQYSQYKFTPLQLRDGGVISEPHVARIGLMRGGCVVQGEDQWRLERVGASFVLRVEGDRTAYDGWTLTTANETAERDPVRFTLHGSRSSGEVLDELEWDLLGTQRYRTNAGGIIPFSNLDYDTPTARASTVHFDMRTPAGYMLAMVHNRVSVCFFLLAFSLSGVVRRVQHANLTFGACFAVSSVFFVAAAVSYALDGPEHRSEALYWLLFAPASVFLAAVCVLAERHFIVATTLKGAYLVLLDLLTSAFLWRDVGLFLAAPPIGGFLFFGAGALALCCRFRSLQRSRSLISLDMAKYTCMWDHLTSHPSAADTIALISSLVNDIVSAGPPLSRQYNRRRSACRSVTSASTDTPHAADSGSGTWGRAVLDGRRVEAALAGHHPPSGPQTMGSEGVIGRLSRSISLSKASLRMSFKNPLDRGSRRWAMGWGWAQAEGQRREELVDVQAPVDSLDQLYRAALALQPILRRKVQHWAAQSRGYFPAGGSEEEGEEERGGSRQRWSASSADLEGGGRAALFTLWEAAVDDPWLQRDIKWGRVKNPQRAVEKLLRSYKQDVSRLVDVSRESIVFDTLDDLAKCLQVIGADREVTVVRAKNKLDHKYDPALTAGYRDVSVNLRIETAETALLQVNNHVCEVQLLLKAFAVLKNEEGHARYIRFRNDRAE